MFLVFHYDKVYSCLLLLICVHCAALMLTTSRTLIKLYLIIYFLCVFSTFFVLSLPLVLSHPL